MNFEVDPLPYPKDALGAAMSSPTLEYHYEKHHKGYMAKLKTAIEGDHDSSQSLLEVIRGASGNVLNNASQVWNHSFFWRSMKPGGGGAPPEGDLADLLTRDFGGFNEFRIQWIKAGTEVFGAGWVWLVAHRNRLRIITTPNGLTPVLTGAIPLMNADVWEHAYYLDYQNRRDTYLEVFCDQLLNWDHVAERLGDAPTLEGTEYDDTIQHKT